MLPRTIRATPFSWKNRLPFSFARSFGRRPPQSISRRVADPLLTATLPPRLHRRQAPLLPALRIAAVARSCSSPFLIPSLLLLLLHPPLFHLGVFRRVRSPRVALAHFGAKAPPLSPIECCRCAPGFRDLSACAPSPHAARRSGWPDSIDRLPDRGMLPTARACSPLRWLWLGRLLIENSGSTLCRGLGVPLLAMGNAR